MFYCEACRVKRGWPKGLGLSEGNCEICNCTRKCSDVPSKALPKIGSRKMMVLLPCSTQVPLSSLIETDIYHVVRVVAQEAKRVVMEFADADPQNPDTEPVVIGSVREQDSLFTRVFWHDRLWLVGDTQLGNLMGMLQGIKGDPKDFKLPEGQ